MPLHRTCTTHDDAAGIHLRLYKECATLQQQQNCSKSEPYTRVIAPLSCVRVLTCSTKRRIQNLTVSNTIHKFCDLQILAEMFCVRRF